MSENKLTKAYIQRVIDPDRVILNISLSDIRILNDTPNLLIIHSTTENCARISIYPIHKEKILKLTLLGSTISEEITEFLSKVLHTFDVIHTSGLLLKKKQLFYECYLNLSFTDTKYEDLKIALHTIPNIFKEIKIEEIGLKSNQD